MLPKLKRKMLKTLCRTKFEYLKSLKLSAYLILVRIILMIR